jgi:hypothetical protein
MTAKPNAVADIRRQVIELERQISELVEVSPPAGPKDTKLPAAEM